MAEHTGYRGYEIRSYPSGLVEIWWYGDRITSKMESRADAIQTIDEWLDAR